MQTFSPQLEHLLGRLKKRTRTLVLLSFCVALATSSSHTHRVFPASSDEESSGDDDMMAQVVELDGDGKVNGGQENDVEGPRVCDIDG